MAPCDGCSPPLPEGSVVTSELHVVAYIDADGNNAYGVATRGEAQMTTMLGLTIVAQDHIRQWGREGRP